MFVDLDQDAAIVSLFVNKGGRKFLIASTDGQGFIVNEDDCVGNTRKGKQVMNVKIPAEAKAITVVSGDMVVAIGSNHKMVVFGIDQVPEMARGRGVRLQKYTSASLSDVTTFDSKEGLNWKDSAGRDQSMTMKELVDWRGNRADAGRLAHGLPKSNKFGKAVE
jgi:topoisomerase-4 subunit A